VLQRQLALPAVRPRTPPPPPDPAPSRQLALPAAQPVQSVAASEHETEPWELEDVGTLERTMPDDRTFLTRARSSVALVVLLALVGAAVALLIGAALFLLELAIQNTVG
jgi:hypothetical protein